MSPENQSSSTRFQLWREHFPVDWLDDDFLTRREFTKSLGLVSFATFVATMSVAAIDSLRRDSDRIHASIKVADLRDLPVGRASLFFYPTHDNPCLVIRTAETQVVAFEQKCTHLGCPVHYDHADGQLVCPCHAGFFSAEDGRVLAGPPKRALPQIELEVRGDCRHASTDRD